MINKVGDVIQSGHGVFANLFSNYRSMLYDCVKTSTVLRSTSVTAFNERRFSASAQNFEEYPEHRTNFFLLLQAVNSHCFDAFLAIDPAQFKLVLDAIIWAFKHTMRNVADTGACGSY